MLALGFCLLFPVTLPAASAAQDIAKTIDRTGAASRGTATGTEVSPESRPRDPFPWLNRKPPRDPVFPEILIEPAQLLHQLPELDLLPLDLRSFERYMRGHLPGALHLDWEEPLRRALAEEDPEPFRAWLSARGLGVPERLLLYGDEQNTALLGRFFWALAWAGWPEPALLNGGIAAWARRGGALTRGIPATPPPGPAPEKPRDELSARRDWVLQQMGREDDCEILDLRDTVAWAASASEGSRQGHLPHSLPYDFEALLPGDGRWPTGKALRSEFAKLGPRPRDFVSLDAEFVLYGEDDADARPGLAYMMLRMMDIRARVLLGGWTSWAGRPELPVVRIISAEELAGMLKREQPELADVVPQDFALIDLRGHRDFNLDHLPGATALPAHTVDDSLAVLLRSRWRKLDPDRDTLVFYCYGTECVRSRIAATKAARLGWRQLLIFKGGVSAWREAELPLAGGGKFLTQPRERRRGR